MPTRTTALRLDSLSVVPYYVGFVVTGMATVLLGAILPVLSARWSLTDLQAGSLFAAQFTGSSIGAVLASHFRYRCLVLGYAAVAGGLAALALGNYAVVLLAFALLGTGLGCANTATNLTFGTEYPSQRGALLTRVNFFWGIGAVSCPPFVAMAARPEMLRLLLLALSLGALAVVTAFAPLLRFSNTKQQNDGRHNDEKPHLIIFVLFSLLLFLYVGGETSFSGWIASYAHRFGDLSPAHSSLFVSAFWMCVVLGRGAVPLLIRFIPEFALLVSGVIAALFGIALLLFPQSAAISLAAVALTGLGCAPIFPLSVARLLARIGDSRHAGWIFAICGSGAAVLPWMTGLLSAQVGSLRTAFTVPFAAMSGVLLLILLESTTRLLPRSGEHANLISP